MPKETPQLSKILKSFPCKFYGGKFRIMRFSLRLLRGPVGPLSYRVLRGGDWDFYAYGARCAYRSYNNPSSDSYYRGFRCVRVL
jgi:hypothetical protein